MTLGNRIKAARVRLVPEVTQKEIGDAFGISDKAVSGWERDDSAPARDKLPKLARLLKVTLAWLSEGAGDLPAPDSLEVMIEDLTPTERSFLAASIAALRAQRRAA